MSHTRRVTDWRPNPPDAGFKVETAVTFCTFIDLRHMIAGLLVVDIERTISIAGRRFDNVNYTRIFSLVSAGVCGALITPTFAGKPPPSVNTLSITQVFVAYDDPSGDTLTINGKGFDAGAVTVTLGEYGQLPIISSGATSIVAWCPSVASSPPICEEGDYLLTVKSGALIDKYDLTVGAVGPQGATGPQGVQGEIGPPGTTVHFGRMCSSSTHVVGFDIPILYEFSVEEPAVTI